MKTKTASTLSIYGANSTPKYKKALGGFSSLSGIPNWSRNQPNTTIVLSQCIPMMDHLRLASDIPNDQPIWNRKKIKKLKSKTILRKFKFFSLFGVSVFVVGLTGLIYLVGLGCAFVGNECTSTIPHLRYAIILVLFSLVSAGLILQTKLTGKNQYKTKFEDYFHPDLTSSQKQALATEIKRLKENFTSIFEIANEERVLELGPMPWTAENWFLILTDNESDRSAIMRDGRAPSGVLYIAKQNGTYSAADTGSHWDKLEHEDFTYIVSDMDRLQEFIKRKMNSPLVRNQSHWLLGFMKIQERYDDYQKFLDHKYWPNREEFVREFALIFAEISNDKSKNGKNPDLNEIGYKGAIKFLRGRNTSIRDWIKSP